MKSFSIAQNIRLLFMLLGLLNDLGIYLILASSESLASFFDSSNLEPLFPL